MGNQTSSSSSSSKSRRNSRAAAEDAAERAKRVVGDIQEGFKASVKKLDDDHPAAQIIDSMCGTYFDDRYRYKYSRSGSYGSEEGSEDGTAYRSEDDTTYDGRRSDRNRKSSDKSVGSASYTTYSDYESVEPSRRDRKSSGGLDRRKGGGGGDDEETQTSFDTEFEDESKAPTAFSEEPKLISKPLASSFAKRCYFTKSGIGKTIQHYEGLTLTGNVVLMLAAAMKLKGCPTICDEDLRRVEQTYPNQFSRLPDELLLSSGWRRISKYCHFSNKPIPDGVPFFHSKQRLHPEGGYFFLLAAAVGMVRPIDVEPLTRDTLVLLETDFPTQCDATPKVLVREPEQWVLVNKFCFFSGGPINAEEDVYYQADFDGNPIYMLAFLSPSLTPEELYRLSEVGPDNAPGLKSVAEVEEVESVYDLTDRDFDDLKLYHLGPCRALPQYVLQPSAWTKVLPPHFLAARQQAMLRAQDFEVRGLEGAGMNAMNHGTNMPHPMESSLAHQNYDHVGQMPPAGPHPGSHAVAQRSDIDAEEDGAFHGDVDLDAHGIGVSPPGDMNGHPRMDFGRESTGSLKLDPPDDEPPSLKKGSMEQMEGTEPPYYPDPGDVMPSLGESAFEDQAFFSVAEHPLDTPASQAPGGSNQYVSPESASASNHQYFDQGEQPASESHPANFQDSRDEIIDNEEDKLNDANDHAKQVGTDGQQYDIDQPIPTQQAIKSSMNPMHPSDDRDEKKEAIDYFEESQKPPSHPTGTTVDPMNQKMADISLDQSFENQSHQSPAMQGAHDVLMRNRQRRLEALANNTSPTKQARGVKSPSEASAGTWDDSGSEFTGSAISAGSSFLTDASGTGDKSSRRALILQMAKARMKNNKEKEFSTHTKTTMQSPASPILEAHETSSVPSSRGPDIDLTEDLD
mmetsp:Transcript_14157/g.34082  ORF Transcript_14157/g.34082 Transcript_14157/m.34082 type:complete len:908 (+) Transcript_14157:498-3221(+)